MIEQYWSTRYTAYLNYASQCYSTASASQSEACRPYVKPRLSYSVVKNASCPFQDGMCIYKSGNILLDTGYLDSLQDFGINTPPSLRFSFRMTLQCAPIVTQGFTKLYPSNDTNKPDSIHYHYGASSHSIPDRDNSFTYQTVVDMSARSLDNYTSLQSPWPEYIVR